MPATTSPATTPGTRRTLRVGCGEWGFRDRPMPEHFEIARQLGFRTLEFGIGGGKVGRLPEVTTDQDIAGFLRLVDEYGIRAPFCCIENDFTLTDPTAHAAMLAKVCDQMRVAARARATHVRLFAGFTPLDRMTDRLWQQLIAAFRQCQSVASESGLRIAIETHGAIDHGAGGAAIHHPTVTTDAVSLQRLLEELPVEIGFNYDPGNIKAAEQSSTSLHLDLLDGRINYCHLKDWRPLRDGWEACAIGDDKIDYPALLARMSFEGVYLIEYEPLHDTIEGIQRSLDLLRRHFDVVLD